MSDYTLGLDIGANSVGWALLETGDGASVIDAGVRIFQEGVVNKDQGDREKSRNVERREARRPKKISPSSLLLFFTCPMLFSSSHNPFFHTGYFIIRQVLQKFLKEGGVWGRGKLFSRSFSLPQPHIRPSSSPKKYWRPHQQNYPQYP